MSLKRTGCLAVLALAGVLFLKTQSAECITIKPAAFDRVVAEVPAVVMAGVEFEIGITFVDRFGNPMGDDWKPGSSLTLHVSQPASVQPSVLTAENYTPGFRYSIRTEKMGELTLSLRDDTGRVLERWDLQIKSGRPVRLLVDVPSTAEVGETVKLSLQAVDAHGNVAYGYEPAAGSLLFEKGSAVPAGGIEGVAGGVYEVPVRFRASGPQSVAVRDRKNGLSGLSETVNVTPAPLESFQVRAANDRTLAGEELELVIRAQDRYGNLVADYNSRYKGVRLYAGRAGIAPDLVPPAAFENGTARIGVIMRSAGRHTIRVSEIQSNISGEFQVRVLPAEATVFSVGTPESATAGEPFEITVTAMDEYGNRASSLPPGAVVRLRSTGTDELNPGIVEGSGFREGVATVEVYYEKAESFEIKAALASGGGITDSPRVNEKEKARMRASKAREDAVRARRESRLREKRLSQSTASSGRQPARRAVSAPEKTAPSSVEERPSTPSASVKPETAKPAAESSPSVAAGRITRPGVLDSILVEENMTRALVTFSTNGMTDYNVTTSSKLSRKWIDIDFPDITVDLPDRIEGGEEIVGEVYVIQSADEDSSVRVSVEILPTRIGYDVYQKGQSLVLKVKRQ